MKYTLAIDQGSHSSRAIIYDENGALVDHQSKPVTLFRNKNGFIEHEPLEILDSINTVLDLLFASLSSDVYDNIVTCGLACQRSTVLACTKQGEPLSPAISWQDVRGASYLESLPLATKQVRDLSGLPVSPHYAASKCRWLLENQPKVKAVPRDNLCLSPLSSFLLFHLLKNSKFVVDHTQAQRMQLMNIESLDWSEKLANAFQITMNLLPACKPVCDDYGLLKNTHIPVTAVCGDQNAALFGSGPMNEETALINLGSGAFILRLLPTLKKSGELLTGIACSSKNKTLYMREGTVNGAGNAVEWFLNKYPLADWKEHLPVWLDQINQPPVFINTVGGVGSPWWLHDIEPCFIHEKTGLDEQASVSAKAVAVIESIVFLLQDNLNIMNQEQRLSLLKVSGGLSQLDGLCQKLANLSQIPVKRMVDKEATALGIARLTNGCHMSTSDQTEQFDTYFEPDEKSKNKDLLERYQTFRSYLIKRDLCKKDMTDKNGLNIPDSP